MAKCVCVLQVLLCLSSALYSQVFTNIGGQEQIWHQDLSPDFGSGVSLADVNQDGWDDITLLRGQIGPKLYLNSPNGFSEFNLNIYLPYDLKQACWVDIDNNGVRDLAITCYGGPFKVYKNGGNLSMSDVTASTNIIGEDHLTYAQSWADYDRDGDLDLYISNYNGDGFGDPSIENFLYSNNGDFTFTDVTTAAGIGNGSTETLAATWFDHNNDLWPDLMIANDRGYTPNALYLNNGDGTFTDISTTTNTHIFIDAMGLAIDDFNGDNKDDIYVTNNWGNRLHESTNDTYVESNSLFDFNVNFLSWGASWLDYDNDGARDLYVAVDYYLTEQNYNRLYRQTPDGTFDQVTVGNYNLEDQGHSYGSAIGDYNNDGFQDIAVVSSPPYYTKFWQNNLNDHHWLKCNLTGIVSNRDAIGSTIFCYSAHHAQRQVVRCGESYLSQNTFTEFFGMGTDGLVDSLIVVWPSGIIDKWYNIPVNQTLSLVEGQGFALQYSTEHPIRLCNNEEVAFAIENQGLVGLEWNEEDFEDVLYIDEPGEYIAMFSDSFGNQFLSDTIFVGHAVAPEAFWQLDIPVCADEEAIFQMLQVDDYSWEIDGVSYEDSIVIDIQEGESVLQLYDANGCSFFYSIDVELPDPLEVELELDGVACNGSCSVQIELEVEGGTAPYTWNVPNPDAMFWCPGPHNLLLSDAHGCTRSVSFVIPEPTPIQIVTSVSMPSCYGEEDGMIEVDLIGGTGTLAFSADFEVGQLLGAGSYTASVEDELGCGAETTIQVSQPEMLFANIDVVQDVDGMGVGIATVTPSGGTPPYSYWWSNGSGNVNASVGLFAGTYMVQVTDANGCSDAFSFDVDSGSGVNVNESSALRIYPNPVNDKLFVMSDKHIVDLQMYDAQGALVTLEKSSQSMLDCSHLAAGVYTLIAHTSGGFIRHRVVVQ